MSLAPGTKLGPYEIVAPLGAGGMGEVYRARDTVLKREVAVKILPDSYSSDPDRLHRFQQEAEAAAALNHPNILTIHQVGQQDGISYIVTELLRGDTLREKLRGGPLPVRTAIDYAVQIARGLATAHEKGIVHRDLKPENLFVTRDGRIKILDFGLAKLTQPQPSSVATLRTASQETTPGAVMGTMGYMSPEQVRGQPADPRSDIFAFGAVLFEMLTGNRAFHGATSADTISAILLEDPPRVSQIVPGIPHGLQRVVHRCLEKNPEQRFQSASDLAFALQSLSDLSGMEVALATAQQSWPLRMSARARLIAIPSAVAAALLLATAGYFYFHRAPTLTDRDTVVIADFANSTDDAVFDGTLKQALETELQQSPFLSILSNQKVEEALKLMGRRADEHLDEKAWLDLCQRMGSKAMLRGSIASLGSQYVINLNATNCQTGDSLASEEARANKKEEVLNALDTAAAKLRTKLGESLTSVQKFDKPLAEVTTPSLEALKAFSLGEQAQSERGDAAAIPFLKHAIELDPSFAGAYALLGDFYGNVGETGLSRENLRKAYGLRTRLSEREKFWISHAYFSDATGELEKSIEVEEMAARAYPRSAGPPNDMAVAYLNLGQPEQCLPEALTALHLAPDSGDAHAILMYCYVALDRFAEAKATYEQALARKLNNAFLHQVRYAIAFLEGDTGEMEVQVAWAAGKPGVEDSFLSYQALSHAFFGRLGKAREMFPRAVESARRNDEKEVAGMYKATAAWMEADFGNPVRAREEAIAALTLSSEQSAQTRAAVALASAGDSSRALQLTDELAKRYPLDTLLNGYWLPAIRARVEINRHNPTRAIALLHTASPYERSMPNNPMFAAYLRGQSYLVLRSGGEAAKEFQRILDHRGVVWNGWQGALAHLGLARAYAISGDAAKARAAYQDFLTLWKDADPDIPILVEAKAEYAKLH